MKKLSILLYLLRGYLSVNAGNFIAAEQAYAARVKARLERTQIAARDFQNRSDFAENFAIGLKELDEGVESNFITSLLFRGDSRYTDLFECCLGDAVVKGKFNRVRKLLSIGVPASGAFRRIPLLVLACNLKACEYKVAIIQLLLENGANPRTPNWDKKTLINSVNDDEIKKLLLQYDFKGEYVGDITYLSYDEFVDDEELPDAFTTIMFEEQAQANKHHIVKSAALSAIISTHQSEEQKAIMKNDQHIISSSEELSEKGYAAQISDFIQNHKIATSITVALLAGLSYKYMQSKKAKNC